jgi:nucleoside-diphosphate-sugar epimerase
MKKILITGGLGHIGSYLIDKLSKDFELIVIDNFLTQRYCSLFDIPNPIHFIEKDIKDITLDDLNGVETVIHLAAITDAAGSFENKEIVESINYEQTKMFIDRCEESGCKFIFPSSTSVYGVAADMVTEDDERFLNPQSPYAESKIKIENYIKEKVSTYLILRFGTIFGISKGMRFHTAINKFCYEASLGRPLTIWRENFEQYRPYLGINDAVRALVFFLEKDIHNQTFNILSGNWMLKEVVNKINKHKAVKLKMVDTPLLNQFSYHVSDEKATKIGWKSKDVLEKAIKDTLQKLSNLRDEKE